LSCLDSDPDFLDSLVDDAPAVLRDYSLSDADIPALVAYLRGRSAAIAEPQRRRLQAAATFLILAHLGYPVSDHDDQEQR
jgi:hypothetical protein